MLIIGDVKPNHKLLTSTALGIHFRFSEFLSGRDHRRSYSSRPSRTSECCRVRHPLTRIISLVFGEDGPTCKALQYSINRLLQRAVTALPTPCERVITAGSRTGRRLIDQHRTNECSGLKNSMLTCGLVAQHV